MGERRVVLVVEDESSIRGALAELFEVEDVEVHSAASLEEAQRALQARRVDLVVTDIRLGGRHSGGLQVMAAVGLLSPDAAVIVLTAFPDRDNRQASLRLGAAHFLEKPADLAVIASLAARHGVPSAMNRTTPPSRRI
jgi:DNA-binding NtrC family response regulator